MHGKVSGSSNQGKYCGTQLALDYICLKDAIYVFYNIKDINEITI